MRVIKHQKGAFIQILIFCGQLCLFIYQFHTVVGDYINTMKTTFYLNFSQYQVFKQH